jgi:hypothetical protein
MLGDRFGPKHLFNFFSLKKISLGKLSAAAEIRTFLPAMLEEWVGL